jgi:hypothetical protein
MSLRGLFKGSPSSGGGSSGSGGSGSLHVPNEAAASEARLAMERRGREFPELEPDHSGLGSNSLNNRQHEVSFQPHSRTERD